MHEEATTPRLHVADVALQQRWSRIRTAVYVPLDLAWVTFTVLMWRAGQPSWRVAVFAAILLQHVAVQTWEAARSRRSGDVPFDARVLTDSIGFASTFAGVAVSGGIRSPILAMLLTSLPAALVYFGWSPRTKTRTAWVLGGVLALSLAPASWVEPIVPGGTYAAMAAVAVFTVVFVVTHGVGMLLGAAHISVVDAFRAREEVAEHALARAKDLEHIGAQLSHELKNPLGAIKALVQVSLRSTRDEDRERLEVIQSEVLRMQQVLQDYLSFARPLEKLHRQPLALGPLADEVIAILEARATDARVTMRRRGDARVDADARRLKEALINLVANAIEASPAGGSVEIEVARGDGEAIVTVRDTGRGMPPDVLERVGTPFFTTRDEGTGLGVALARATFVQHGGSLVYSSAPGAGTTATATLPARAASSGEQRSVDATRALGR